MAVTTRENHLTMYRMTTKLVLRKLELTMVVIINEAINDSVFIAILKGECDLF